MFKQRFGPGAEPEVRNYFGYTTTFLNKVVRISPLLPERWIDFFVANRARMPVRSAFTIVYGVLAWFVEPISFFYLMLKSFRNNLTLTLRFSLPTFKTKIRERLINF